MNKFQPIPKAYVCNPLHHRTYLINGELREWNGSCDEVYSTISSTEQYAPTLVGSVTHLTEKEALEALEAAGEAYGKGNASERSCRDIRALYQTDTTQAR